MASGRQAVWSTPRRPRPRQAGPGVVMSSEGQVRRDAGASGPLVFGSVVLLFLMLCGLLVYGAGRGFDLTDEVFYLIWARDPRAYDLVYQPFGYLLHPLFELVGGYLQTYRLAGFAVAAAAGAFLGGSLPAAQAQRTLFSLYGAAAALTIFFPWIITPSYNSTANVGAMLIVGGGLRAFAPSPRSRAAGALAVAAGLCLAAFGKPPLFALSVAGLALAALAARRARAPLIAALALGAAFVCLVLSPAELVRLVGRMSASQHVLSLPNTPLALPAKIVSDALAVPLPLAAAAIAAAASFLLRRTRWAAVTGYAAIALSIAYLASVAADAIHAWIPDFLGLAVVTATAGYAGVLRDRSPATGLLLAAPAAVALGTFNNQWFQLNFSMAFPFLALFALAAADPVEARRGVARALAVAGPAGVMLLAASAPYSLPASIFEQQIRVASPLTRGSIRVDRETATFVRSASGLASGAVLVDLSGAGPGVAAALGARAPVLPWLNPATPTWPGVVWSRMSARERETASFVGPIWPAFASSAPARWLVAHQAGYCRTPLPPMTFWHETRALELWRPCAPARIGK